MWWLCLCCCHGLRRHDGLAERRLLLCLLGRLLLLLLLLLLLEVVLLGRCKVRVHAEAVDALLRLHLGELRRIQALHHGILLLRLHAHLALLLRLSQLCAWWDVGAHRLNRRLLHHLKPLEL